MNYDDYRYQIMGSMISILFPWRDPGDPWRSRLKDWVRLWWEFMYPQAEKIYATGPVDGPFNRSAAINQAASQAHGAVFIIADTDTIPSRAAVQRAIARADLNEWTLPYTVYYNLDQPTTYQTLAGLPRGAAELSVPTTWVYRLEDSVSGCVVVPREIFDDVGGFDERFESWGMEDRAFYATLSTLAAGGRLESHLLHLWHYAPESGRSESPWYQKNQRLYQDYAEAQWSPPAMRRLVDGRKILR